MLGLVEKLKSPNELGLQPTYHRLDVILDKCARGANYISERDTTHFGWLRHAAANSCRSALQSGLSSRITHHLVHAATVHTAGQVAHLLYPVTKDLGPDGISRWSTTVEALVHSENELRHAKISNPGVSPE